MEPLLAKLEHPLWEVRCRALVSLRSKLRAGLVSSDALAQVYALPEALLDFAAQPPAERADGVAMQLNALALLEAVASEDRGAYRLAALGAASTLHQIAATADSQVGEAANLVSRAAMRSLPESAQLPSSEETPPRCLVGRGISLKAPTSSTPAVRDHPTPEGPPAAPGAAAPCAAVRPPSAVSPACGELSGFSASSSAAARRALSYAPAVVGSWAPERDGAFQTAPATSGLPEASWTRLPTPILSQSDEAALHQACVALQQPGTRGLCAACLAFAELADDLPIGALLRRPSAIEGILSLIRTAEHAPDGHLGELGGAALAAVGSVTSRLALEIRARADPLRHVAQSVPTQQTSGGAPSGSAALTGAAARWPVWKLAAALWSSLTPLLRRPAAVPVLAPQLLSLLPLLDPPQRDLPTVSRTHPAQAAPFDAAFEAAVPLWRDLLLGLCGALHAHGLAGLTTGESLPLSSEAAPLLLLLICAASTIPERLLRAAAPPALRTMLRLAAAEPWLAVCQPHVQALARQKLRVLDEGVRVISDGAATVEAAARHACRLDAHLESLGSVGRAVGGAVGGGVGGGIMTTWPCLRRVSIDELTELCACVGV